MNDLFDYLNNVNSNFLECEPKSRTPKQKKRHNEYLRTLKRDQIVWTITGEVISWDVVKRTLTYRAEGVNELGVKFTGEAMEKDDQLQQITNIKVK